MASLQFRCLQSSSCHPRFCASLFPSNNMRSKSIYLRKLPIKDLILRQDNTAAPAKEAPSQITAPNGDNKDLLAKLLTIAEAVADRANMHDIIGTQRNNWNHLFTNSINSFTLTASLIAGLSSVPLPEAAPQLSVLKIAATLLFAVATGTMLIVNKIQPSQLAEEQRKATWMWRQLERSIQDGLALRTPTESDVADAMRRVLALEKAYPLPLLPGMLEKFPEMVEPAQWWPEQLPRDGGVSGGERNGWSEELEAEMRGLLRILKVKDEEEYVKVGKVVLRINRSLAAAGPVFAGLASVGSGLIGLAGLGPLPAVVAVTGGALAAVVNTVEHAGQVGMVFELCRNNAGFYRWIQEEIELNLGEEDVEKRENGELFKLKLALQLGRSLSDFSVFVPYASPSCSREDVEAFQGFAGKLF